MEYSYSIIIPHYNDFDRLKRLVSTIPIRVDIEIIIIDDNSTVFPDISAFPDRAIQVLLNNSGIQSAGACRNIGLKAAKGKWLLFADSDDFFVQGAFDFIDEFSETEYDIVYFKTTSFDLSTGSISDRHIFFNNLIYDFIAGKNERIRYAFSVPWGKLISNNFIQKKSIIFDEVIVSNDIIFSLKSGCLASKIAVSEKEIYCITNREGSLTTIFEPNVLRVRYQMSLKRNSLLSELNLNIYQESFISLIKKYYQILDFKSCCKLFKLTISGELALVPTRWKLLFIDTIGHYMDKFLYKFNLMK